MHLIELNGVAGCTFCKCEPRPRYHQPTTTIMVLFFSRHLFLLKLYIHIGYENSRAKPIFQPWISFLAFARDREKSIPSISYRFVLIWWVWVIGWMFMPLQCMSFLFTLLYKQLYVCHGWHNHMQRIFRCISASEWIAKRHMIVSRYAYYGAWTCENHDKYSIHYLYQIR